MGAGSAPTTPSACPGCRRCSPRPHRVGDLDTHTSVIEGSAGAIPRRLMVQEKDETRARAVLKELGEVGRSAAELIATSDDTLLGGRVKLRQPIDGYRVAIDPRCWRFGTSRARRIALDIGCGTGAASLCLAARVLGCSIVGLERDPAMARLVVENIAGNDRRIGCRSSKAIRSRRRPRSRRAASRR